MEKKPAQNQFFSSTTFIVLAGTNIPATKLPPDCVARVLPLRVTLPTRGVRQAFTQVLQTEVGKPLTVQLTAINARTPNWWARLGLALGGFLVLWVVVAGVGGALAGRRARA